MKRIFAAIKIHPDEPLLKLYYALKAACRYDRINWVDPQNMHITLKFFGETAGDLIPGIIKGLQAVAQQHQPFVLQLKGTGVFGSFYKPRVIWLGIPENPALISLGQDILDEMDQLGYKKDRQNFVPHLTLGRIKITDNKERFFDLVEKHREDEMPPQPVQEFLLFESMLSTSGPTYSVLERFGLKNN